MNFEPKFRIVRDNYAGYEAQVKTWYFPFWRQINFTNTSLTVERAKGVIERYKKGIKPSRYRHPIVWESEKGDE